MLPKKICARNIVFLSSLLLSACATNPPDKPLCVELSISRGYCTNIVSGKSFMVDEEFKLEGKTWFEMRPYMIQMPPDTWAELKKFIIDICKKTNACDDKQISSWNRTAETLDIQIGEKVPNVPLP